jgi:capsular exopolysaccharide synthesis family protein
MTLRQVLEILWQRKLLVIATLVIAIAAAAGYMRYSVKTYEATAIVKLNGAATASSDTNSSYAGIEVDTDIDAITSMPVIGPAAATLGGTDSAALTASLKVDVTEGVRTNKINIHAVGSSPAEAQARANAVASAYVDYLAGQVDDGKKRLLRDKSKTAKQVRQLQDELAHDKKNSVLQTYLEGDSARLGEIQSQLDQLAFAGKPAVVQKQASLGTSTSITPVTILGIGVLSGLLAGAGIALVREQFDERLHSSKQTEGATGEPILAEVAVDRRRRKGDMSLPTATHRATAFTESIRTLRTSLQVLAPPSHAVIVVTSPEPGDGKSFVTANLAVSMSLAGRSVIVVGGDLRQGRIGQYFGAGADAKGFAEAIAANADANALGELLRQTEHEGLRLLPPGSSKAEPADLLAADTLRDVIGRLRDMADVVLIDTPPALALADAAIIAGQADGVVVLTHVGRTQRETLLATLRVLRANAAHVYGVVSNRSRRSMPKTYQEYLGAAAGWESPFSVQSPGQSQEAQPSGRRALADDQSAANMKQQVSAPTRADTPSESGDGRYQTRFAETDSMDPERQLLESIGHEDSRIILGAPTTDDEQVSDEGHEFVEKRVSNGERLSDDQQSSDDELPSTSDGTDAEMAREPEQVSHPVEADKTVDGWDLYILEYPPVNGEPESASEDESIDWSWDWDLDDPGRSHDSVIGRADNGLAAHSTTEASRAS